MELTPDEQEYQRLCDLKMHESIETPFHFITRIPTGLIYANKSNSRFVYIDFTNFTKVYFNKKK